jgi:hypothetical protein
LVAITTLSRIAERGPAAFGFATCITVRSVEEIHATIESPTDQRVSEICTDLIDRAHVPVAGREGHRPESEPGYQ